MRMIIDLGMLYPTSRSKERKHYAVYECPYCGKNFKVRVTHIKNGHTKSCGCKVVEWRRKSVLKHNMSSTKLYNAYKTIKSRCYNKNSVVYKYYGGKGVQMCDEWKNNFMSFYDWSVTHGYKEGLVIDRINGNKNYCPENCRWVTYVVNNQNTNRKPNGSSGYFGVQKDHHKWIASISHMGTRFYLGIFNTAKEAATSYNNFIIEHHTFHTLNIIE